MFAISLYMAIVENKLIFAVIGILAAYLLIKMFSKASKSEKVYEKQLDKILNSDENKVKGRFE